MDSSVVKKNVALVAIILVVLTVITGVVYKVRMGESKALEADAYTGEEYVAITETVNSTLVETTASSSQTTTANTATSKTTTTDVVQTTSVSETEETELSTEAEVINAEMPAENEVGGNVVKSVNTSKPRTTTAATFSTTGSTTMGTTEQETSSTVETTACEAEDEEETLDPPDFSVIAEPEPALSLEDVKSKYRDTISRDMDVTQLSGFTLEEFQCLMDGITKDDKNDFYSVHAEEIYNLCVDNGINEIFFCGIISAESWWGTADNAVSHHNYTGMMSNRKLIYYNSDYEGLEATATRLSTKYLTEGGSLYHGKTIAGVSVCYCDSAWVDLVWGRMQEIF